jgi:hypothetical protein
MFVGSSYLWLVVIHETDDGEIVYVGYNLLGKVTYDNLVHYRRISDTQVVLMCGAGGCDLYHSFIWNVRITQQI